MAESTVFYTPEQNGGGSVPAWLAYNNGGLGNGFGGLGGGILGFLLGLFFGNGGWGNGFGGFGGGNSAGAGFLSNQMNNDSGRELLMNALTSQGEASRTAIQNLATMIGQDFNLVNNGVQAIQNALASVATQQAVSVPQIINAIQAGDTALANQFSQCCCNMKLMVTEQGYQSQLRTLEQTNMLGSQADRNTNSIISAINAQTVAMNDGFCAIKERELQDKIDSLTAQNTVLRNQIDNAAQTAQFSAMLAPIVAQVNLIASRQPSTVPVIWPQLTVTSDTPTTGA